MKRLILILLILFAANVAQATTISISSTQVSNFNYVQGATVAYLRIWATESFVDSSGTFILGGNVGQLQSVYKTVTCVVSSGTLTIPSFTLTSTTDSLDSPQVTYVAYLYDQNGTRRDLWMSDFQIPVLNLTTTWAAIRLYNQNVPAPRPNEFYSKDQINSLLHANYPCSNASDITIGCAKASVAPADPLNPIFLGANDPLLTGLPLSTNKQISPSTGARLVIANQYSGSDVGAKINAADIDLGSNKGTIYYFGGGTITTQIVLSQNHTLHLGAGTYTPTLTGAPILMKEDTTLEGEGYQTIVKETSHADDGTHNAWAVIAQYGGYFSNGTTTRNITIRNLQLASGRTDFDSVMPAVPLGNCHHCLVENIYLNGTHSIGINVGGASTVGGDTLGLGRYAEDVTVRNCSFDNVASQNLSVVNGKNITFEGNNFRDPSQATGPGVTVIDAEVNDATNDRMENIQFLNNKLDARASAIVPHGNFIAYQPGTAYSGPAKISGNQAFSNFHTSNGIFLSSNAKNVEISNNYLFGMGQSGLSLRGTRLDVFGNNVIDTGTGGVASVGVVGVTSSYIHENIIDNPTGQRAFIEESSAATQNYYWDNALTSLTPPAITVLAGSINFSWINNGVRQVGKQAFMGSTSGTTTLQATAIAGATTLTLPAATDTLVGLATTDTLTNKTINGANNTITGLPAGVIGSGPLSSVGAATTTYICPNVTSFNGTENIRQWPAPFSGTLKNLKVYTNGAQPGDGTLVITIRVAGVDSTVVVTIAAGGAGGVYTDTTHSIAISADQLVSFKLVNNSPGTGSTSVITITAEIEK